MYRQIVAAMLAAASILTVVLDAGTATAAGRRGGSEILDAYCLLGRSYGYPGNCQFATFEQCRATSSGANSGCGINPRYGYGVEALGRIIN